MPKGKPNPQTIASAKYQAKAGYMTKGFKLKRDLVNEFQNACIANGRSQAEVISEFMRDYIKRSKAE